jgi:DNA polymerase III delta prime subunit
LRAVTFAGRREVLSRFREIVASDRLGQSYLFLGPEGAGKEATALEIARVANCVRRPACEGTPWCESCSKALTFQHPDIRWLGPAPAALTAEGVREMLTAKQEQPFYQAPFAASSSVTIGDPDAPGPLTVRSLIRFLRLRAFQGRLKVAVLSDAHRLTEEAANALLKTLEEPPPASVIFLLAPHRLGLLPTILSRCQQVRFEPFAAEELAAVLTALSGVDRERALSIARLADGNGRRAVALLRPQTLALLNWAGRLFEWIDEGREGSVQLAADQLHEGVIPAEMIPPELGSPVPAAKDLAAKRERAIQLCEMLNLYYSDLLMCQERGTDWQPRLVGAADRVRRIAARRSSRTLLEDIARVEIAKGEIDGNLNIGLTMAVLGQELVNNAQRDRTIIGLR